MITKAALTYIWQVLFDVKNNCCLCSWKCHKSTPNWTNVRTCYTASWIFVIFSKNWTSWGNNCHGVPAFYVQIIPSYTTWLFYNLIKDVPTSDVLNTTPMELLRRNQSAVSSLDWHHALNNSVFGFVTATWYRLNISMQFDTQPTPFILTKYRHTIQLRNLSVYITI